MHLCDDIMLMLDAVFQCLRGLRNERFEQMSYLVKNYQELTENFALLRVFVFERPRLCRIYHLVAERHQPPDVRECVVQPPLVYRLGNVFFNLCDCMSNIFIRCSRHKIPRIELFGKR